MKFLSQHVSRVFAALFVLCVLLLPVATAHAQFFTNLCQNPPQCTLDELFGLGNRIINFLIIISIPLATILFAYAGFLLLTAGENAGQRSHAKEIFWKVMWGFIFVLSAWVIVRTVTSLFLKPGSYYDPLSIAAFIMHC